MRKPEASKAVVSYQKNATKETQKKPPNSLDLGG
jgi:hypothetical protein